MFIFITFRILIFFTYYFDLKAIFPTTCCLTCITKWWLLIELFTYKRNIIINIQAPPKLFTGPVQNFSSLTHSFSYYFLTLFSFNVVFFSFSCYFNLLSPKKKCKPYFRGLRTTSWSFLTFFLARGCPGTIWLF